MYPDYNPSPVFHPQRETGSEQFTHCLTSSVREEVEKTLVMMALSPIPLTWQNRGCRARYSSNLQLWAELAEFKLLRSSGLLIAALLWDTSEGRQAHNERCAAATCMLETGYGEENSEGNSSLKFWKHYLLTHRLLSKLHVFFMDKYNVDGAFLLTLCKIYLVTIWQISHFYTTDANDWFNQSQILCCDWAPMWVMEEEDR